jgi:hypothetical protein
MSRLLGTLFGVDPNGDQYRLVSKDIGVRLNRWDHVKASLLTIATASSVGFGVSFAFLIAGLIQVVREREG